MFKPGKVCFMHTVAQIGTTEHVCKELGMFKKHVMYCKDRSKRHSLVSAYPYGKRRFLFIQFLFICLININICFFNPLWKYLLTLLTIWIKVEKYRSCKKISPRIAKLYVCARWLLLPINRRPFFHLDYRIKSSLYHMPWTKDSV